ncbi:MAG: hypothetical protein U1E58_01440 [Tabrizicola sp.]
MREICLSGLADKAKLIARGNRVAVPDQKRTLLQMAVLSLPALSVVDDDAIPAFPAGNDRGKIGFPAAPGPGSWSKYCWM